MYAVRRPPNTQSRTTSVYFSADYKLLHHFSDYHFVYFVLWYDNWAIGLVCRRLEEIAAAASKEYLLEKNLHKMKDEWNDMCFEFVQYRDSVSHFCDKL